MRIIQIFSSRWRKIISEEIYEEFLLEERWEILPGKKNATHYFFSEGQKGYCRWRKKGYQNTAEENLQYIEEQKKEILKKNPLKKGEKFEEKYKIAFDTCNDEITF